MKLNQTVINQIYEECKPLAIYQVGSSIVCKNPKDVDILLIYKNDADREATGGRVKKKYYDNEIRYDTFTSTLGELEGNLSYFMYEGGKYLKLLAGREIDVSRYNLFTNPEFRKKSLLTILDRLMVKKYNNSTENQYGAKPYRMLMSCYILDNGDYKLTREQIKVLNEIHDTREMSQELWDYCEKVVIEKLTEMDKESSK